MSRLGRMLPEVLTPVSKVFKGADSQGGYFTWSIDHYSCVPHGAVHDPSFFPSSLKSSQSLPEEGLLFPADLAAS